MLGAGDLGKFAFHYHLSYFSNFYLALFQMYGDFLKILFIFCRYSKLFITSFSKHCYVLVFFPIVFDRHIIIMSDSNSWRLCGLFLFCCFLRFSSYLLCLLWKVYSPYYLSSRLNVVALREDLCITISRSLEHFH